MNALRREIRASAAGDIERTGPETIVRRYRFAPGFVGFSGHFPGNPILPAIVQVCAVVSLAEEEDGKTLRLAAVRYAKFLSPIRPDEEVSISYRRRVDSVEDIRDATLSVAGTTSAVFQLRLTDEETPP
jgi:3-hydroxyacyl-[acyl-carrier-protein] dehydratase